MDLKAGASEGFHHLISGVGASVVALTADDLVLGGKTQLGGEVVFGLGAAGVDNLLLLAVAEKAEDEDFVGNEFLLALGFQLADERLSTFQLVHGLDEAKEGILVVADSINSGTGVTPPVSFISFSGRFFSSRGQEKSGSSQLEDTDEGDGGTESTGGGGQEGDGQGTIISHSGQGSKTLDKGQKAEEEKSQESLAVHC